jgi:hypothetical protein
MIVISPLPTPNVKRVIVRMVCGTWRHKMQHLMRGDTVATRLKNKKAALGAAFSKTS